MKAEFTILMDHDGYWLAEKSQAAAIMASPEQYRANAIKTSTKIAACRLALEKAVSIGATELHLDGVGATTGVKKEVRKAGIKPFIYFASAMTDLTSEWARRRVGQENVV